MKYTLKSYNDLGKCSYATLMEEFDPQRDKIFVSGVEMKIDCLEDLFPFLWQSPSVYSRNPDGSVAHFNGPGTHWHQQFDRAQEKRLERVMKLDAKRCADDSDKKRTQYQSKIAEEMNDLVSIYNMLESLDKRRDRQIERLIEENRESN